MECFKIIAKKLKNVQDEILGYHLTEIIFTLQNACKDRVHKVQLAGSSAIRDWRIIEEIFEKNKKKGKYDKQKILSDKETNLFKLEKEYNLQGDNFCKEDYENKTNEKKHDFKIKNLNKLNVLRNLSKLNKQDSNSNGNNKYNSNFNENINNINYEEDFFQKRRNNRNINDFYKLDEIKNRKSNNDLNRDENYKNLISESNKEETFRKGIGNALKLSNLLKNFQKENKIKILKDNRSKSNPKSIQKISPPKNKLLESVANYLRNSKSGNKNEFSNKVIGNEFDNFNERDNYNKGKKTDINFYNNKNEKKKIFSPSNNKQDLNFSQEELLDYQFLSDGEFDDNNNNFIFENEASKNIEKYEKMQRNLNKEENKKKKNRYEKFEIKDKDDDVNIRNIQMNDINKSHILNLKTDLNNFFFNFMQRMENFNNNMNSKLNNLEVKIKKNKKLLKRVLKKKIKKLSEKNESQLQPKKNITSEDNKNDDIEKDSKMILKKKEKESSKILYTNSSKMNNENINNSNNFKEFKGNNESINKGSNIEYDQAKLIEKLKREIEFYRSNSQDIFKNTNYGVSSNQNTKDPNSIKFWREILELIEEKEYNRAYIKVLEGGDDLYLIRLLLVTGPILNFLKLDVCKKLIMRTNLIFRSHQIEFTLLELIKCSYEHYIFNLLSKNEQNELLESIFQIMNLKSTISKPASKIYEEITANVYL